MLIFWKARLVLLAVPKTGTTAIEAALAPHADAAIVNPPGLKHMGVRKWRRELAPVFERGGRRPLETVAVMREPVDWLSSWWRYRSRPELDGQPNSTAGTTFDGFVTDYLSPGPPDRARVGSQAAFLEGGVDHLFRHDRPDAFLAFLSDRLNLTIAPGRANVSPVRRADLSPDIAARLRRERAADFALWEALGEGPPDDG